MKRLIAVLLCVSFLLYACVPGNTQQESTDPKKDSAVSQQDKAWVQRDSYLEEFGRKYMQEDSLLEQWMDASLRRIFRAALANAKKTLRYVPHL